MKNKVQDGKIIEYLNTTDTAILSGDLAVFGALAGIAVTDIAAGDSGSVALEGVYTLPKADGPITQGSKLYWVSADKNLKTTATGNTYVGVAANSALSAEVMVNLLLVNGI